jgi:proline iminopeptidase
MEPCRTDEWTLVGHSWGADLALAYGLAQSPAISSIVSFAGTGVQNDRDWHAAYQARRHEEPHGHYDSNPKVQACLLQDWRGFIKSPDLLARLARLQVPITFLHPASDIRPSWPAQKLSDLVPYGRYVELPDAPHEAWLTHQEPLV